MTTDHKEKYFFKKVAFLEESFHHHSLKSFKILAGEFLVLGSYV